MCENADEETINLLIFIIALVSCGERFPCNVGGGRPKTMKNYLSTFLKGLGMGAANVIPGVSGGTIALITGIFERLINAIKSFDMVAIKLLVAGKFKELLKHVDFKFLLSVGLGVAVSILSIARLFDFLFINYPIYIWSFFFGLILASVFYVGKEVGRWRMAQVLSFLIGSSVAVSISVLSPASPNDSFFYLVGCGVIGACSMILPGLSGSFVLILMGNYQLIMIDAVNEMNLAILLPVVLGAGVGLLAFSYVLAWVFKRFRTQTLALLSGFILGSLLILWPWKNEVTETFGDKVKVVGYDWLLPHQLNSEVMLALACAILGIISIVVMEKLAKKSS